MTPMPTRRMSWTLAPRWIWPVLMGSLALNVLVAGSLLGQRMRPAPALPPGIAARLAHDASTPLVRELSGDKRTRIRGIFEAHRGQNRPLWLALRERRVEVTKILEAEPFDTAAYVAAMTRLIEAEAKARISSQTTFAEVAATLSPKERQDFLDTHRQLRQQLKPPPRDGNNRGDAAGRRDRQGDGPSPAGTGDRK